MVAPKTRQTSNWYSFPLWSLKAVFIIFTSSVQTQTIAPTLKKV